MKLRAKVKDEAAQEPKKVGEELPGTPMFTPPKKKRKWVKWVIILAVVVGLVAMALNWLGNAGQQMLSAYYMTGAATVRDMTVKVSSTGTVTPIESYNVASLVTGEILEAPFEEGDWVEKGDLLYRFDAQDAQDAVARAQLALSQATLAYNTTAQSTQPTATGAGIVQKLHVKKGDSVAAGTLLAEISDTATMLIDIPFHAADAQGMYAGQSAAITLAGTMETLSGTVLSVSGADEVGPGNAILRRVRFEVANPGALAGGTSATAMVGAVACAGSGVFEQRSSHMVMAQTGGEISALHVAEGASVSYGQAIATIGGTNAENTLENARISVQSAQISLDSAVRALDNYVITAPIAGTIIEKNFKAGDKVESNNLTAKGGVLATIFDMSTLNFQMRIDELDINKIQIGQPVTITANGVEGRSYEGVVDSINLNGATVSGMTTYPITVEIYTPEDLKPGMNVSADVIVDRLGEVLCIPVDAVKRGSDGPVIRVAPATAVGANGTLIDMTGVQERTVTLGRNDDRFIEVTSGLEEGEIVVWESTMRDPMSAMMGG